VSQEQEEQEQEEGHQQEGRQEEKQKQQQEHELSLIDDTYLTLSDFVTLRAASWHWRAPSTVAAPEGAPASQWERLNNETGARATSDNNRRGATMSTGHTQRASWATRASELADSATTSTSSSSSSTLSAELAALEWRAWPEYDYFSSQFGPSASTASQQTTTSSDHVQWADGADLGPAGTNAARQKAPPIGLGAPHEQQQQQQQRQRAAAAASGSSWAAGQPFQLLDLQADETITTGVNVLHLAELNRDQLGPLLDERSSGAARHHNGPASASGRLASTPTSVSGSATVSSSQTVSRSETVSSGESAGTAADELEPRISSAGQLECRASNLHYDLRALIKLFAPPSLLLGAGERPSSAPQESSRAMGQPFFGPALGGGALGREPSVASRQLVEAIERSLVANLRPLQSPAEEQATTKRQETEGPKLSQIGLDGQSGGPAEVVGAGTLGRSSSALNWAHLQQTMDEEQRQAHSAETVAVAETEAVPETVAGKQQTPSSSAWPTLIRQQLLRPHHLGEQLTATWLAESTSKGEQVPSRDRSQPAARRSKLGPSGELAGWDKSKLIALDAYRKCQAWRLGWPAGLSCRPPELRVRGGRPPLAPLAPLAPPRSRAAPNGRPIMRAPHRLRCFRAHFRPAAALFWPPRWPTFSAQGIIITPFLFPLTWRLSSQTPNTIQLNK